MISIHDTYEQLLDHVELLMKTMTEDFTFWCEKIEHITDFTTVGVFSSTNNKEIIEKDVILKDLKIRQREHKIERILNGTN